MHSQPLKGSNLTTVKGINSRLILHLMRVHKTLTKAEATRMTGLSANAISMIFRALEKEGFLLKGNLIRGKRGQPSTEIRLNPDVRHYIGFKVGRRSFDLVLINFIGDIKARIVSYHRYPTPSNTLRFIEENLSTLLSEAQLLHEDISAFNIACPFELWNWASDFDAPLQEMETWRDFDLKESIKEIVEWPVSIENDGTAASRAELLFGPDLKAQDLVYFFVGTFIGGGVVLNGSVFPGLRGGAGGFGPLRVPDERGGERLVDHASLVTLEHMMTEQTLPIAQDIYLEAFDWSQGEEAVSAWLKRAGRSLGHAIVSTLAVIDFETVVIDGAFPATIRERLIREIEAQLDKLDLQGIVRPVINAGHFAHVARALGAAGYQISTEFMINQNTLLRESPTTFLND
ncbi:ROK family protein [Marinomonas spartinae]|uniref:ROK family protein n=1 Tax=Marinomonas spartinae TaxID=1792290 RepID=UPI0018F25C12|nr:ROK family protein [Marinomonas spartinae]MBJ7554493.1 ROK family protein [Marinomonas spartinae]